MNTKLRFIIPVILLVMFILYMTSRQSDGNKIPSGIVSASDIDRIEIEHGDYYFNSYYGYIIDFNKNTLTVTEEGQIRRVTHFSEEDKENFVRKANMYDFFLWKKSYVKLNVSDGGYAYFLTTYNDGSQHETSCHNAYPPTYREMWKSYIEIFNNCIDKENNYEN